MNYALIENGVVINLIWLYEGNAHEFPNAVALGDRPVAIGDSYQNGVFIKANPPEETSIEDQIAALMARIESLKAQK